MSSVTAQPELVQEVAPGLGAIEQQARGEIDIQITTAKRYPRSIKTFMDHAMEMATLTEEIAESCFYALPRDGKTVEGPSARLAEICASAWGHMRIEGKVINEDERFITARGTAWDLQNNVAIGYEVRRRITGRDNKKYKDDMVVVTGNAAASIALRNAIFKVVPSSFWRPIYEQCRKVAVGDAQTLADRRAKMLAHFQKMGVPIARVLAQLGVVGVEDITLEHLGTMKGLATAIKEGDTTVDEAFPLTPITMPQRKSATAAAPGDATPSASSESHVEPSGGGSVAVASAEPEVAGNTPVLPVQPIGVRIVDVRRLPGSSVFEIVDDRGVVCTSDDRSIVMAATVAKDKGYVMEITSSNGVIEEIRRAEAANGK